MAASNAIGAEIRRNRILMGTLAAGLFVSSAVVSNYRAMFPLGAPPRAFAALTQPEAASGGAPGGGIGGGSHHYRPGYPIGRTREHHAGEPLAADRGPVTDRAAAEAPAPQATAPAPTQIASAEPFGATPQTNPVEPFGGTSGGDSSTVGGPTTSSSSTSSSSSGGPAPSTSSTTSGGPVISSTTGGSTSGGGPDPVSPAPEPETWALMIFGFGLIGALAYRRSRRNAVSV